MPPTEMGGFDWTLLAATARVILAYGVVFVLVPGMVLPGAAARGEGRVAGDAILVTAAAMLSGIAFGLLGMGDRFTFLSAALLGFAACAWVRYRTTWQRTLLLSYGRFLVRLERIAPPTAPVQAAPPVDVAALWPSHRPAPLPAPAHRTIEPGRLVAAGLVLALSVLAVSARLWPSLLDPAPTSVAFYADLEGIKGLLLGDPIRLDGEWGLHALALVLSSLSQVDPANTLRALGALSAGALTLSVYATVRAYGGGRPGGLVAAAVIAYGGAILPIPLERQVEGNALMLAAALAVAAGPAAAAYFREGRARDGAVVGAAVIACGLTHLAVGVVLAVGLVLLDATRLLRVGAAERGRALQVALGLFAGLAGLAVGYRALVATSREGMVRFLDIGDLGALTWPAGLCVTVGAALVGAALADATWRERRRGDVAAGATCVCAGLVLVIAPNDAYGIAGAAAVLGTGALAVAAGLLAEPLVSRIARHVRSGPDGLVAATALAVLGVALAQVPGAAPERGRPVEPSGYVRAYAGVQRVAFPLQWTIVGSTAQRIRALGRGRFMDYEYFLARYDPTQYDHTGPGAIPTEDLFIFVETDPLRPLTVDELSPGGGRWGLAATDWVAAYRARADAPVPLETFYRDADVVVYRLHRAEPSLLAQRPTTPSP